MLTYDPDTFLTQQVQRQEIINIRTKQFRPLHELDVNNDTPFSERSIKKVELEMKIKSNECDKKQSSPEIVHNHRDYKAIASALIQKYYQKMVPREEMVKILSLKRKNPYSNIANYVSKVDTYLSREGYRLLTQRALGYWVLKLDDGNPEGVPLINAKSSENKGVMATKVDAKSIDSNYLDHEIKVSIIESKELNLSMILSGLELHPEHIPAFKKILEDLGYTMKIKIILEKV